MRLPFCLAISAPLYEVLPVLTLALFEAEKVWHRRTLEHSTTWQWEQEDGDEDGNENGSEGTIIQLAIGDEPTKSLIRMNGAMLQPNETLPNIIKQIMKMLREYDFDFTLVPINEAKSVAIFIAPHDASYLALAPLVASVVEKYGLHFHYPAPDAMTPSNLELIVQDAALVIGVWDTLPGQNALYQSWMQQRPLLAFVGQKATAAKWLSPLIDYSQQHDIFLAALDKAVARRVQKASPNGLNGQQKTTVNPSHRHGKAMRAEFRSNQLLNGGARSLIQHDRRRLIYREVALDKTLPLEQRLHAARVLSESGDSQLAAEALGDLLMSQEIGELANHAFALLGSLGKSAQSVLWYLDAQTADPWRAMAIARQLARAGDVQTALFRLDRLAQHAEEEIRFAALDTMAETGLLAKPNFQELAHYARDPKIRFKAVEWLYEQGTSLENLIMILKDLSWQTQQPAIARSAIEMLAKIGHETMIEATILRIAQRSPSVEARLAAAEELHQRGQIDKARRVLLKIAQGDDYITADAALDKLLDLSDKVTSDTARVMNNAGLKQVRRRAAEMLTEPNQPKAVQQAAVRVLLALDWPQLATPVLGRLARNHNKALPADEADIQIARWAAQQLALIGEEAVEELRRSFGQINDPVVGQYLAEGLLSFSFEVDDRRQAALWLARHSNLPRAIEVLRELALSARISGSIAVEITNDIGGYAAHWAGAARALAKLVSDSPHPAVRTRALDLLLRDYPSELPLALLVDLAVTGSIGVADRLPVMEQLNVLARPAATRIATRLADEKIQTERRWQLLQLINELPQTAATQALLQLSAGAPQNRIRYVAAEQLIARGQLQAGYAALTTIAINEPDGRLREMALYELIQGLPESEDLIKSIIERTRYEDTFHLARQLFFRRRRLVGSKVNHWLDQLVLRWDTWVASLPLSWFDGLGMRALSDRRE